MRTASHSFLSRPLTLGLSLFALAMAPVACDVEDAEDLELEALEADEAEPERDLVDEAEDARDPEAADEPCLDGDCGPLMEPDFDLTAAPDVMEGTACGGAVQHHHGGDLFPGTYQEIMGCDCASGQRRDYYTYFNNGHGSCTALGWVSPDPRDCRVRMQINRSGGYANGTCNLVVEQSPAGSCYSAQTNTGCNNVSITNCVCAEDPYCCYTQWDALCASEVTTLGCG